MDFGNSLKSLSMRLDIYINNNNNNNNNNIMLYTGKT
jgi:hypothetical protein